MIADDDIDNEDNCNDDNSDIQYLERKKSNIIIMSAKTINPFFRHFSFKIVKCKRDMAALKTMVATDMQQRLVLLVFNHLLSSVID